MMNKGTLYQRLLRDDFELLPPVLQRFHSLPTVSYATGNLTVKSGNGPLRHGAARLLGLPKPATNVPIRLEVIPEGPNERWVRHFGSQCIESLQWEEDGLLVEQVGPLRFYFRVFGSETGIQFEFQHNRLRNWRLPALCSLRVGATASALPLAKDCWNIEVNFQSRLLGILTTYSGTIQPAD